MPATAPSAYDAQSLKGFLRFLELLVDFREARIAELLAEFSATAPPRYDVRMFRIELTRSGQRSATRRSSLPEPAASPETALALSRNSDAARHASRPAPRGVLAALQRAGSFRHKT